MKARLILVLIILFGCNKINRQSDYKDGVAVYQNSKSKKYGYVNTKNIIIIEAEYDFAEPFDGRLAIVNQNGKSGVINRDNEIIIPINFDNLRRINSEFFLTTKYKKFGLYNNVGREVIPNIYEKIGPDIIDLKYIPVYKSKRDDEKFFHLGIYSLLQDKLVTELHYEKLDTIVNNFAIFDRGFRPRIIDLSNSNNPINQFHTKNFYIDVCSDVQNTFFKVYGMASEPLVLNTEGKQIIYGYDFIGDYGEGLFVVNVKGKGYGYSNLNNQLVIKNVFEKAEGFKNKVASVLFNGATFSIDRNGKCVIDCPSEKWFENYGSPDFAVQSDSYVKIVELGLSLANSKNYQKSIEKFTEAIAINPTGTKAYYNRGLSYLIEGQLKLAYEDLAKASILEPDEANIFYILGVIKEKQQEYQSALAFFLEAVNLDPNHSDAYLKMAIINQKFYQNREKACEYIIIACNLGNVDACEGKIRFCI